VLSMHSYSPRNRRPDSYSAVSGPNSTSGGNLVVVIGILVSYSYHTSTGTGTGPTGPWLHRCLELPHYSITSSFGERRTRMAPNPAVWCCSPIVGVGKSENRG